MLKAKLILLKYFFKLYFKELCQIYLLSSYVFRKTIMKNAIHNTEAIVVVSQENMLEKLKHSEVTKSVCKHIYHMTCLCFQYVIIIMPPLCTCRLVCPSVFFCFESITQNSFTFLPQTSSTHPSLIAEKSYRFWGHWVKVLDLLSLYLFHTSILSSIGTLLILGSLDQRSISPGSNV